MKKYLALPLIMILSVVSHAQEVEVIDVPGLQKLISQSNGTTKVINFWATWCKPCVEEMPFFEEVRADDRFNNVEIVLVSVDFIEDLDSKVKKFIDRKKIGATVKLIDNVDYNSWIDKVDPRWSGEIPATLIIDPGTEKRAFYTGSFKQGELQEILINF